MKAINTICASFLVVFLFSHHLSFSQETMLLHTMREVPQSGWTNPAFIPPCKGYFNFLIPGVSVSAGNSGFNWGDLVKRRSSDNSYYLDFSSAIAEMKESNFLNSSARVEPLSFGFRFGKNYLSMATSVRTELALRYPAKLFELLDQGSESFIGKPMNLDKLAFIGTAWVENSIALSRQFNDKFALGFRFKVINGLGNVHLAENKINLFTPAGMTEMTLESDFLINTSFPVEAEFYFPKSRGYGFDFGFTLKPVDALTLSAGVIDLGSIEWKENLTSYRSKSSSSFSFSGLGLNELFDEGSSFGSGFDAMIDSLDNIATIDEFSEIYKTPLPTTWHFGVNYQFSKNNQIGALMNFRRFEDEYIPSASLLYHRNLGRVFAATAAVSYHNQSFNNVGFGFSLNLGFLQIYALSGNVLSVFIPDKARNIGGQFGLNFLIGRLDKDSTPIIIEIRDDLWD